MTSQASIRYAVVVCLVVMATRQQPINAKPSGPSQPIGGQDSVSQDYADLQRILGGRLPGSAKENIKIIDLLIQLLEEIDLPTLCDVIANDTTFVKSANQIDRFINGRGSRPIKTTKWMEESTKTKNTDGSEGNKNNMLYETKNIKMFNDKDISKNTENTEDDETNLTELPTNFSPKMAMYPTSMRGGESHSIPYKGKKGRTLRRRVIIPRRFNHRRISNDGSAVQFPRHRRPFSRMRPENLKKIPIPLSQIKGMMMSRQMSPAMMNLKTNEAMTNYGRKMGGGSGVDGVIVNSGKGGSVSGSSDTDGYFYKLVNNFARPRSRPYSRRLILGDQPFLKNNNNKIANKKVDESRNNDANTYNENSVDNSIPGKNDDKQNYIQDWSATTRQDTRKNLLSRISKPKGGKIVRRIIYRKRKGDNNEGKRGPIRYKVVRRIPRYRGENSNNNKDEKYDVMNGMTNNGGDDGSRQMNYLMKKNQENTGHFYEEATPGSRSDFGVKVVEKSTGNGEMNDVRELTNKGDNSNSDAPIWTTDNMVTYYSESNGDANTENELSDDGLDTTETIDETAGLETSENSYIDFSASNTVEASFPTRMTTVSGPSSSFAAQELTSAPSSTTNSNNNIDNFVNFPQDTKITDFSDSTTAATPKYDVKKPTMMPNGTTNFDDTKMKTKPTGIPNDNGGDYTKDTSFELEHNGLSEEDIENMIEPYIIKTDKIGKNKTPKTTDKYDSLGVDKIDNETPSLTISEKESIDYTTTTKTYLFGSEEIEDNSNELERYSVTNANVDDIPKTTTVSQRSVEQNSNVEDVIETGIDYDEIKSLDTYDEKITIYTTQPKHVTENETAMNLQHPTQSTTVATDVRKNIQNETNSMKNDVITKFPKQANNTKDETIRVISFSKQIHGNNDGYNNNADDGLIAESRVISIDKTSTTSASHVSSTQETDGARNHPTKTSPKPITEVAASGSNNVKQFPIKNNKDSNKANDNVSVTKERVLENPNTTNKIDSLSSRNFGEETTSPFSTTHISSSSSHDTEINSQTTREVNSNSNRINNEDGSSTTHLSQEMMTSMNIPQDSTITSTTTTPPPPPSSSSSSSLQTHTNTKMYDTTEVLIGTDMASTIDINTGNLKVTVRAHDGVDSLPTTTTSDNLDDSSNSNQANKTLFDNDEKIKNGAETLEPTEVKIDPYMNRIHKIENDETTVKHTSQQTNLPEEVKDKLSPPTTTTLSYTNKNSAAGDNLIAVTERYEEASNEININSNNGKDDSSLFISSTSPSTRMNSEKTTQAGEANAMNDDNENVTMTTREQGRRDETTKQYYRQTTTTTASENPSEEMNMESGEFSGDSMSNIANAASSQEVKPTDTQNRNNMDSVTPPIDDIKDTILQQKSTTTRGQTDEGRQNTETNSQSTTTKIKMLHSESPTTASTTATHNNPDTTTSNKADNSSSNNKTLSQSPITNTSTPNPAHNNTKKTDIHQTQNQTSTPISYISDFVTTVVSMLTTNKDDEEIASDSSLNKNTDLYDDSNNQSKIDVEIVATTKITNISNTIETSRNDTDVENESIISTISKSIKLPKLTDGYESLIMTKDEKLTPEQQSENEATTQENVFENNSESELKEDDERFTTESFGFKDETTTAGSDDNLLKHTADDSQTFSNQNVGEESKPKLEPTERATESPTTSQLNLEKTTTTTNLMNQNVATNSPNTHNHQHNSTMSMKLIEESKIQHVLNTDTDADNEISSTTDNTRIILSSTNHQHLTNSENQNAEQNNKRTTIPTTKTTTTSTTSTTQENNDIENINNSPNINLKHTVKNEDQTNSENQEQNHHQSNTITSPTTTRTTTTKTTSQKTNELEDFNERFSYWKNLQNTEKENVKMTGLDQLSRLHGVKHPNKPKASVYNRIGSSQSKYSNNDFNNQETSHEKFDNFKQPSLNTIDYWKAFNIAVNEDKNKNKNKLGATKHDGDFEGSDIKHWTGYEWNNNNNNNNYDNNNVDVGSQNYYYKDTSNNRMQGGLPSLSSYLHPEYYRRPMNSNNNPFSPSSPDTMETKHEKDWGDRFSQGFYGRVYDDDQNKNQNSDTAATAIRRNNNNMNLNKFPRFQKPETNFDLPSTHNQLPSYNHPIKNGKSFEETEEVVGRHNSILSPDSNVYSPHIVVSKNDPEGGDFSEEDLRKIMWENNDNINNDQYKFNVHTSDQIESRKMQNNNHNNNNLIQPNTNLELDESQSSHGDTAVSHESANVEDNDRNTVLLLKSKDKKRKEGEDVTENPSRPASHSTSRSSGTSRRRGLWPLYGMTGPLGVPAPGDYTCPGMFGYHSDPQDCQSFFICSWGVPYRLHCPPGTRFNRVQSVCDWAVNVPCLTGVRDN